MRKSLTTNSLGSLSKLAESQHGTTGSMTAATYGCQIKYLHFSQDQIALKQKCFVSLMGPAYPYKGCNNGFDPLAQFQEKPILSE